MGTWGGRLALGVAAILGCGATSFAFYLDKGRNFDVRARAYSQLGIMTENSAREGCGLVKAADGSALFRDDPRRCPPEHSAGDLGQHRKFYKPELDAKLTDYRRWWQAAACWRGVAPDDLKSGFAWWGFYDGLYGSLARVWDNHRRNPNTQFYATMPPAAFANR